MESVVHFSLFILPYISSSIYSTTLEGCFKLLFPSHFIVLMQMFDIFILFPMFMLRNRLHNIFLSVRFSSLGIFLHYMNATTVYPRSSDTHSELRKNSFSFLIARVHQGYIYNDIDFI